MRAYRAPWITLSMCLATVLIASIPGAATVAQFDREAIAAGEWWRVFSGHLAHWNADHLLWDLLTFATLSTLCERAGRVRMAACLAIASVAISLVIWGMLPQIQLYRGLSGLDTALFALLAGSAWITAMRGQNWRVAALWALPLAAMGGKLIYETATGTAPFVDAAAAGFEPLVTAHAIGAIAGLAAALTPWSMNRNEAMLNRGVSCKAC